MNGGMTQWSADLRHHCGLSVVDAPVQDTAGTPMVRQYSPRQGASSRRAHFRSDEACSQTSVQVLLKESPSSRPQTRMQRASGRYNTIGAPVSRLDRIRGVSTRMRRSLRTIWPRSQFVSAEGFHRLREPHVQGLGPDSHAVDTTDVSNTSSARIDRGWIAVSRPPTVDGRTDSPQASLLWHKPTSRLLLTSVLVKDILSIAGRSRTTANLGARPPIPRWQMAVSTREDQTWTDVGS